MIRITIQVFTRWRKLWRAWQEWRAILRSLDRRAELHCLIAWARCKKLSTPLQLYNNRLQDEEKRLATLCMKHTRTAFWATIFHEFQNQVTPTRRYYPKGSAAKYRYRTP